MAVADRRRSTVTAAVGLLVSVDGVNGAAVAKAARKAFSEAGRGPGGISSWDASGVFSEMVCGGDEAGPPSARTLLLLYASDLMFRLRWEIEPALAEGKTVVAAPYIETAVAFGRAAGLSGGWLANLFRFARPVGERRIVDAIPPRSKAKPKGFAEFACAQLSGYVLGLTREQLMARTVRQLGLAAARANRRRVTRPAGKAKLGQKHHH
jgi:hypothetical protein